ncbi:MAG: acetolactate synthase large subunit, partial [Verrucomicrobia bacterium]|nr:acetolactate synthase large subunit [Verrucomicrobiota bacterium]
MPKKNAAKKSTATAPSAVSAKTGVKMRGCDVMVRCLENLGVDTIFAYPGGASMELHQGLTRSKKIRTILPRHEQGGAFMAHGYARSTGKPGVCMATSGPGATNLVTAIADAHMDSIPLICITGQVYQQFIGRAAFQETDFYGMTLPIVKHSFLVLDYNELPSIMYKAFKIATTGRPGPVVIDIPKDIQQHEWVPVFPKNPDDVSIPGLPTPPKCADSELEQVLRLIEGAKQPAIYIGGGILSGDAHKELRAFAEATGIPVASTLMGLGAFPCDHPQSLYWYGIHSDIKHALSRLTALAKKGFKKPDLKKWYETINGWKKEHPYPFSYERKTKHILPQEAIEVLFEETKGKAIISTGVGQHQMWAPQYYRFNEPRRFISSLGAGTMGFGLPAAIGAKVANPDTQVIDIDGDGSFLMNIQELACMKIEKINAKILILNNQHLGMVVQWEDRFYAGSRGHTILGDAKNIGSPDNPGGLYPDFVKIANGFGIKARQVMKREDLRAAMRE